MKLDKKVIMKRVLPVLAGGLIGYAYYYFIGCAGGGCPITSNPYISTVYGAVAGFIISFPGSKKQAEENSKPEM